MAKRRNAGQPRHQRPLALPKGNSPRENGFHSLPGAIVHTPYVATRAASESPQGRSISPLSRSTPQNTTAESRPVSRPPFSTHGSFGGFDTATESQLAKSSSRGECKDCQERCPSYGLAGDTKQLWCALCATKHPEAVNIRAIYSDHSPRGDGGTPIKLQSFPAAQQTPSGGTGGLPANSTPALSELLRTDSVEAVAATVAGRLLVELESQPRGEALEAMGRLGDAAAPHGPGRLGAVKRS
jgi:hypothetical protein